MIAMMTLMTMRKISRVLGRRIEVGKTPRCSLPPVPKGRAETIFERLALLYGEVRDREAQLRAGAARAVTAPKVAGYGLQLREKQKVKRTYGLLERQFRNYLRRPLVPRVRRAKTSSSCLSVALDNVVWRAGLASSRSQARQLVLHGHVRINGKKVNIPSYLVNVGEEVAIKEKMHQNAMVLEARNVAQSQNAVPWLEQEREQFKAKVVAMPKRDDVQTRRRLIDNCTSK